MDLDPALFLDAGAFALLAVLVMRWFGRVDAVLEKLAEAITAQSTSHYAVLRSQTLLIAAIREDRRDVAADLATQALEVLAELERGKRTP